MSHNFPEAPVAENTRDRSLKLADFAHFWKLDEPDWVAQREADWQQYLKPVFSDYPKAEQKLLEAYFKYGKKDKYYPELDWFFLTPYDSPESLKQFMNSSMMDAGGVQTIMSLYFTGDLYCFDGCPWYRSHMELFIAAYFSEGYTLITEGPWDTISPPPQPGANILPNMR